MVRIMVSIEIAVVMCHLISPARAEPERPRGVLSGRVVEAEMLTPIEGATIVITSSSDSSAKSTVSGLTGANGRFAYSLPPGRYDLLALFGESRWVHRGVEIA